MTFSVSGGGINITTPCDDWNQSARDIHSDRIEQAIAYLRLAAKALRGEI